MKSDVETLNPTRVKLTVEVPFEELKPSLDAAYKKIGGQVPIPGFRQGKVPAADHRPARSAAARCSRRPSTTRCPRFYGEAVRGERGRGPRPARGRRHRVRATASTSRSPPRSTCAPSSSCRTTTASQVDGRRRRGRPTTTSTSSSSGLRERFATLTGVERAAADGDFVSIDLSAVVGRRGRRGRSPPRACATRSAAAQLLDGLDEALAGLSAGESARLHAPRWSAATTPARTATVTVTVVVGQGAGAAGARRRLRPDRERVRHHRRAARRRPRPGSSGMKPVQQGVQARDSVLEALLGTRRRAAARGRRRAEIDARNHNLAHQLESAGMTKDDFLAAEGQTEEEFDADVEKRAREAMTAQFVLDAIAEQGAAVGRRGRSSPSTSSSTRVALRHGPGRSSPRSSSQAGQVPVLVSEVVRGKALALVLEKAPGQRRVGP